jgi:hypothetical protein
MEYLIEQDKLKLCYTEYNMSSSFALFLSSLDFNFLLLYRVKIKSEKL